MSEVCCSALAYFRAVLARKVDGISDEEARRSACPPSVLTLLGLIRHMADVERHWFRRSMAEDVAPIFEEDEEWRLPSDAALADAVAVYWAEVAAADRNLGAASLDDVMPSHPDPQYTVRRTIVHHSASVAILRSLRGWFATKASAVAEAVELAAILLGRTAGAAPAAEQWRHVGLARGWRRAGVDHALGGDRCADPLVDQPDDLQHAPAIADAGLDAVADVHRGGRLDRSAVDGDVATLAGVGGY
jgi:hypothetical protein